MATPSADRTTRRDARSSAGVAPASTVPLGAMREPLGSMERPVPNDAETVERPGYRDPSLAEPTVPVRADRGFATTFALAAVVLLVAFMVALYFGSNGTDVTNTASDTTAPVTETAPAIPNSGSADTTGSTSVAPDATGTATPPVVTPTEPQPATGTTNP